MADLTEKELKLFQAFMQLKDLKAGDVFTAQHLEALNYLHGNTLTQMRALKPKTLEIRFTENGEAYTKGGNTLGVKDHSGKTLLNVD